MQYGSKNNAKKLITTFGRIVEKYRKKQRKTAYRISAEVGLSKTTWREVELGENDLKLSTLWKIAEGLDISADVLISDLKNELGENFSLSDLK